MRRMIHRDRPLPPLSSPSPCTLPNPFAPKALPRIGCDKISILHPKMSSAMEQIATLHIEKLPEGFYLATSDDIPGLVAQGRTIAETLEIARDVAKKLLESRQERQNPIHIHLNEIADVFDYPLIVGI
jgi:predicted RNase H-like HicB family nuclease